MSPLARFVLLVCLGVGLLHNRCPAADGPLLSALRGQTFSTSDTLQPGEEPDADARECLKGLAWVSERFEVTCDESPVAESEVLVRFPSPLPSGDEHNDVVTMEWYPARDDAGGVVVAPAVVVVHESGRNMTVGRLFARGLQARGLHAFLLHLPYYGQRIAPGTRPPAASVVKAIRQAVGDVRRARDAVRALPHVDQSAVALQGTSLGAIVSATSAGLDRAYDHVFLMLAGGNLFDILQNGQRDAAKIRQRLASAGLDDDAVKALCRQVEPLRLAHRVNPQTTWLYSATRDTVIPPANAERLGEAMQLDDAHHTRLLADHYSGVLYLPFILEAIEKRVRAGSGPTEE